MAATDPSFYAGHRNRLRQKFLDDKLTDYEVLELLLTTAIPRRDIRPLARRLFTKFGGVYQVFTAPFEDLMAFSGIGYNTAVFLKLQRRVMLIAYRSCLQEAPIYHDERMMANYCRMLLAGKQVEEFHVLFLDSEMRLVAEEMHSRGTVDNTAVYSNEIAKRALILNARNVVLLHNHPTPNMSFSDTDIETTQQIQHVLSMLGIKVYDHYLVSGGIVYSARNLLLIK